MFFFKWLFFPFVSEQSGFFIWLFFEGIDWKVTHNIWSQNINISKSMLLRTYKMCRCNWSHGWNIFPKVSLFPPQFLVIIIHALVYFVKNLQFWSTFFVITINVALTPLYRGVQLNYWCAKSFKKSYVPPLKLEFGS